MRAPTLCSKKGHFPTLYWAFPLKNFLWASPQTPIFFLYTQVFGSLVSFSFCYGCLENGVFPAVPFHLLIIKINSLLFVTLREKLWTFDNNKIALNGRVVREQPQQLLRRISPSQSELGPMNAHPLKYLHFAFMWNKGLSKSHVCFEATPAAENHE